MDRHLTFQGRLYLVTNLTNGTRYVGQTIGAVDARWKKHIYDAKEGRGSALHRAIRKVMKAYGPENVGQHFSVESVESLPIVYLNQNELDAAEKLEIARLNTYRGRGYNETDGGQNGSTAGPAARQKMSIAALRRPPRSQATRLKMSQSAISRWESAEARREGGERTRRAFTKPEVKERSRQAQLHRYVSVESRLENGERMKKALARPAVRIKLSQSAKRRWESAEARREGGDNTKRGMAAARARRQAALPAGQPPCGIVNPNAPIALTDRHV